MAAAFVVTAHRLVPGVNPSWASRSAGGQYIGHKAEQAWTSSGAAVT